MMTAWGLLLSSSTMRAILRECHGHTLLSFWPTQKEEKKKEKEKRKEEKEERKRRYGVRKSLRRDRNEIEEWHIPYRAIVGIPTC